MASPDVYQSEAVVADYTDCNQLKGGNLPRHLLRGANKPVQPPSDRNGNVLDRRRACSVNRKNPACVQGAAQGNTSEQVKQVHSMQTRAQQQSIRSFEEAYKRGQDNLRRYQQAACSRIVESAAAGP